MKKETRELDTAIFAVREQDYLRGLTLFLDFYGTKEGPPINSPKDASGLSFFGLAVALVQKQYREAVDLCKRAIDLEFYNGDHYANLARIYLAAGQRKKAVQAVESGLKVAPEHDDILAVQQAIGVRKRPAVPFLDRSHPINVTLGQVRQAKAEEEPPAPVRKKRVRKAST
jgi:tetratricopeptide (TPR) repeat protein